MAINNPTKTTIGNALFSWNDTKSTRKQDSQLIVLLNDTNGFNESIVDALANYNANSILWSKRDKRIFRFTLRIKCKTARYWRTERLYIDFLLPDCSGKIIHPEQMNYIILRALWQGRYFYTHFYRCDIATPTRKENDVWDN